MFFKFVFKKKSYLAFLGEIAFVLVTINDWNVISSTLLRRSFLENKRYLETSPKYLLFEQDY